MGFCFIVLDLILLSNAFLKFYFLKGIGVNFTLDPQKERVQKKEGSKKERFQKKPLKKGVSQKLNTQTHNSNTRYKACGIGVECLAKNSNWC